MEKQSGSDLTSQKLSVELRDFDMPIIVTKLGHWFSKRDSEALAYEVPAEFGTSPKSTVFQIDSKSWRVLTVVLVAAYNSAHRGHGPADRPFACDCTLRLAD